MKYINKSKTRKDIKNYSKRSSIEDGVTNEYEKMFLRLLHGIIKIDNRSIEPNSSKTFTKKNLYDALEEFEDSYSITDLLDISEGSKNEEKNLSPGRLLIDDQELNINLNINISDDGVEVNREKNKE